MLSLSCQQDKKRNCECSVCFVTLIKAHYFRHFAIADYMKSQGYDDALESFMRESNMVCIKIADATSFI